MPLRISVVDDDESVRDSTRALLRSAGYEVATFESAETFLNSGLLTDTACLLVDIGMPGMSGFDLQRAVKTSNSAVPIVFITAHDNPRNRRRALEAGAADFLSKPFAAPTLLDAVESAVQSQH